MDVIPVDLIRSMGLDVTTLLPVRSRVFGTSQGSQLNILGGILLQVCAPRRNKSQDPSTLRLFYVASNIVRTYVSLSTLKSLRVISPEFPRIPLTIPQPEIGAAEDQTTSGPGLPTCSNSGTVPSDSKPCSCPRRTLGPQQPPSLPCAPTQANLAVLKQ